MDKINEALVESGYFRARISTLSEFDKIIGGMAWALQMFSYDININVFYADTLDLGQKILLTERIVMVLIAMKCPFRIEPHQIVGLDYGNLYPLIKWLIKRSEEVRREHDAFNRLLALRHYHRVTNQTMPNRSLWSHVLSKGQLNRMMGVSLGKASEKNAPCLDDKTRRLLDKISQDFSENKRVSLVRLPNLFKDTRGSRPETGGGPATNAHVVDESDEDESFGLSAASLATKVRSAKLDSALVAKIEGQIKSCVEPKEQVKLRKEELAQHRELDVELLATNQKILSLLKKLDAIPRKLEINQYQRRYIELHQQLLSKNRDVKKLFDLYNTLDNVKYYLGKEINLLESISESFDLTHDSAANRDLFMKQFRVIISKIQAARDDVQTRLGVIKRKCQVMNAEQAAALLDEESERETSNRFAAEPNRGE